MTNINKAIDLTYLRGQAIALYKLKNKMQETINELEEKIKEGEKNNVLHIGKMPQPGLRG